MRQKLINISIILGLALLLPFGDALAKKKCCKPKNNCFPKVNKCEKYDYIIVGLGSAGSILARKLTDDGKTSVLVLEASVNRQSDPIVLNPVWQENANTLIYSPKYAVTYPVATSFLEATLYSEGNSWGGSSAHNFLIAVRGTPDIYNGWALTSGNPIWQYNNILPYMKAVETYTPVGTPLDPTQRGTSGPISITQSPVLGTDTFFNNFSTVSGTPYLPDYNVPTAPIAISANQQFITPGAPFPGPSHRSYSNLEFLPVGQIIDAQGNGLNGRKLKIISNAHVTNFDISSDKRATAVNYIFTGNKNKVYKAFLRNSGTLILTAGAVRTPKILLHSGVGPAADLQAVGIPVVVDSPNVGQNLQCQYGSSAIVTGGTTLPANTFIDGFPFMPNDGIRRIQSSYSNIGAATFEAISWLTNPKTRGNLKIVDPDPLVDLQLTYVPFSDGPVTEPGTDAYLQVSLYKIIKAAADASGLTMVYPTPAQYAAGDDALLAAAEDLSALVLQAHIVGTTRIAKTIANGVVDGNLSVFGLQNVKIGDIGIEPETVNGNTCFGAYYIALVLANILGVPTPPAL